MAAGVSAITDQGWGPHAAAPDARARAERSTVRLSLNSERTFNLVTNPRGDPPRRVVLCVKS